MVFEELGAPSVPEAASMAAEGLGRAAGVAEDVIEVAEDMAEEDVAVEVKRELTSKQGLLASVAQEEV